MHRPGSEVARSSPCTWPVVGRCMHRPTTGRQGAAQSAQSCQHEAPRAYVAGRREEVTASVAPLSQPPQSAAWGRSMHRPYVVCTWPVCRRVRWAVHVVTLRVLLLSARWPTRASPYWSTRTSSRCFGWRQRQPQPLLVECHQHLLRRERRIVARHILRVERPYRVLDREVRSNAVHQRRLARGLAATDRHRMAVRR